VAEQKQYYIYDQVTKQKVQATKEQFQAYYQPIYRIFAFAKRHHKCSCLHWWRCCGDCGLCDYWKAESQEELERLYYDLKQAGGRHEEEQDPAIIVVQNEFKEKAEEFLGMLSDELLRIYLLYDEGKTQREIATLEGVSQDTICRKLKQITEKFRAYYLLED